MTIPKNVINPFSEGFVEKWELWKAYRWDEHKFKYKGVISEQMALKRICEVSEGNEEKAERIIDQSISRGWMDFYKLKQTSKNGDEEKPAGEPKQSSSKKSETGSSLRDQANAEFNKRYGGGEKSGDSDHLKAV